MLQLETGPGVSGCAEHNYKVLAVYRTMAQKSSGARHGTRRKLKKKRGSTGEIAPRLQQFEAGDLVRIDIEPAVQDGMPHPRFHGRTCEVREMHESTCIVALQDGGKQKEFAVRPVHLSEV